MNNDTETSLFNCALFTVTICYGHFMVTIYCMEVYIIYFALEWESHIFLRFNFLNFCVLQT